MIFQKLIFAALFAAASLSASNNVAKPNYATASGDDIELVINQTPSSVAVHLPRAPDQDLLLQGRDNDYDCRIGSENCNIKFRCRYCWCGGEDEDGEEVYPANAREYLCHRNFKRARTIALFVGTTVGLVVWMITVLCMAKTNSHSH